MSILDEIVRRFDVKPDVAVGLIDYLRKGGDVRERSAMLRQLIGELGLYLVANDLERVPPDGEPDTDPTVLSRYLEASEENAPSSAEASGT